MVFVKRTWNIILCKIFPSNVKFNSFKSKCSKFIYFNSNLVHQTLLYMIWNWQPNLFHVWTSGYTKLENLKHILSWFEIFYGQYALRVRHTKRHHATVRHFVQHMKILKRTIRWIWFDRREFVWFCFRQQIHFSLANSLLLIRVSFTSDSICFDQK